MAPTKNSRVQVGQKIRVTIEKVAHGGHFIARFDGAVIFIRHAIPGEECVVEITSVGSSFNRGDVIEVITPSKDRVIPPCKFSHRNGCGGCDFQHISISRQRELKRDVVREAFLRIAKMDIDLQVEEVGEPLHWRTRFTATTNAKGELGFYGARSHKVIPVDVCLICVSSLKFSELAARKWKADLRIEVATSSNGSRNIATAQISPVTNVRMQEGEPILFEEVSGKTLQVSQQSFYQSHLRAPQLLSQIVMEFADIKMGDHVLDLYGGVGLFTASAIDAVGAGGEIVLIEGSKSATADAVKNFKDLPNVKVITGNVEKLLPRVNRADVIILDPPREGAGKDVVDQMRIVGARSIVYVACDPAALARDSAYLRKAGYELEKLRAFDLFPMTHHIECVALFGKSKVS